MRNGDRLTTLDLNSRLEITPYALYLNLMNLLQMSNVLLEKFPALSSCSVAVTTKLVMTFQQGR